MTGNSLAHLLCQEQKSATADVRVMHLLTVMTGNSLAHLLCKRTEIRNDRYSRRLDPEA
jgi:hypothetical protein